MMNEPSLVSFLTAPIPPPPHPRSLSQEPGGNHTPPQLSPSVGQAAYTAGVPGGSLDVQHLIMQADARRRQRSNDNYFEDVPRSKLERQMAQVSMVRKGGQVGGMNGGGEGERGIDSRKVLWMVKSDTVGCMNAYRTCLVIFYIFHMSTNIFCAMELHCCLKTLMSMGDIFLNCHESGLCSLFSLSPLYTVLLL